MVRGKSESAVEEYGSVLRSTKHTEKRPHFRQRKANIWAGPETKTRPKARTVRAGPEQTVVHMKIGLWRFLLIVVVSPFL